MKIISKLLIIFLLSVSFLSLETNAGFSQLFLGTSPKVDIKCSGGDCNIQTGIQEVKGTVNGIETEKPLSQYIQDIVVHLLTFVSIIAVIYIIYAGFRILTGAGDEETLKKQKTTILYVLIGMAIIWLAYPITIFVIGIFNS